MLPAMPGEPNGTSHRRSEITPAQITELPSMLATITRSRHFIFGRPSPSSSGGILSISKFMAASCHEKGCMATGKLVSRSGSPMYCLWREKQRRRKGQTEPVLQHPTLQMLPHCNGRQVSADRPEWISAEEQIAYRPAAVGKSTLSQVERGPSTVSMPQPKVGASIRFVERRNHPQVLDGLVRTNLPRRLTPLP
jgi:hypothetical protein